jgi:hypothetical protein
MAHAGGEREACNSGKLRSFGGLTKRAWAACNAKQGCAHLVLDDEGEDRNAPRWERLAPDMRTCATVHLTSTLTRLPLELSISP